MSAQRENIHPELFLTKVVCSCGNTFETRSTDSSGVMHLEVCNKCHPFFTGKHKIVTTGQVEKFNKRFGGFGNMQLSGKAQSSDADGSGKKKK